MHAGFRRFTMVIAIAWASLIGACGGDSSPQPTPLPQAPPPPPPAPVALSRVDIVAPESIELQRSAQLAVTAVRTDGTSEDVTSQVVWRSSNFSIVRISGSGEATAVRAGEASISAFYQNRSAAVVIAALPAGTHKLTGTVTEAGHPIDGVTVSVVSGTGTGLSTITGGGGQFSLFGVAGHVTLQGKREGYLNKLIEAEVAKGTRVDFDLVPARGRGNLAGFYTLTMQANCKPGQLAVPESIRTRTYDATLGQNGPALTLKLSSPSILLTNGRGDTFDGNVDPNDNIAFGFGDFYYSYLFYGPVRGTGLLERLSATTELFISGAVSARPASTGVVGRLHGIFLEREGFSEKALCNSDHQFELRRK